MNELVFSLATFALVLFGVWVCLAGQRYRNENALGDEKWRVGATRTVELTLVRQDRENACCEDRKQVDGLRCGYEDARLVAPVGPTTLQPYNTVDSELFLGSGLWEAPDLRSGLPDRRFTAVCKLHIVGTTSSASVRFGTTGGFSPLGRVVPIGALTDCHVPR